MRRAVAVTVGAALIVVTALVGAARVRGTRRAVTEARREIDTVRLELGVENGALAESLVAEREAEIAAASARAANADPEAASRRHATRLVAAAERLGLDVDHVAVDPAAGTFTVGVSGSVASAVAWIAALDATSGAVRAMTLTPGPGGSAAVTVALGAAVVETGSVTGNPTPGGARLADRGPADGWPATSSQRIAAALWIPPRAESPHTESPTGREPTDRLVVASESAPPVHIGTITTTAGQRFAFRLAESGVACLLAPGDTAFGWRLAVVSSSRFRFEKEGDVYEVDR